jgi:hypothetical protein
MVVYWTSINDDKKQGVEVCCLFRFATNYHNTRKFW